MNSRLGLSGEPCGWTAFVTFARLAAIGSSVPDYQCAGPEAESMQAGSYFSNPQAMRFGLTIRCSATARA